MKSLKNIILKAIFAGIALFPILSIKSLDIVRIRICQDSYPNPASPRWNCAEIALYNAFYGKNFPNKKILFPQDMIATLNSAILEGTKTTSRPQGSCKTLADIAKKIGLNIRFLSLTAQNIVIDRKGIRTETPEKLAQKVRAKMVDFILSPTQLIHFLCFITYPGGTYTERGNHGFLISIGKNRQMYVYEDKYTSDPKAYSIVQPQVQAFIDQLTTIHDEAITLTTNATPTRPHEEDPFSNLMLQVSNGYITRGQIQSMGLPEDQVLILLDIAPPMPRDEDDEATLRLIEQLQMEDIAPQTIPQPQSPTLTPDQLQRLRDLGREFTEMANQGIVTIEIIVALVDPDKLNYILTGPLEQRVKYEKQ